MRHFAIFFVLCFFLLPFQEVKAQLIVTEASSLNQWTADSIVRNVLLDQGVTIMNARFNGSASVINCNSIGIFETGPSPTNLGIESGVIIASGGASVALGPNNVGDSGVSTTCSSYSDNDLASIIGGTLFDVAVLEFDFIPNDNNLSFNFVFGSEEYPEYVGSQFNDVFGFFVNGMNPDGGYYSSQNMALIPGTSEVVSINNVNDGHNSSYYVDNYGGATIQFDGFTTVIEVTFEVVPMTTYHIKMAIGDLSDNQYDSAVFLEAHSFTSYNSSLVVDGLAASSFPNGFHHCEGDPVQFDLNLNFTPTRTIWDFGDGQSGTGSPLSHTYSSSGDYFVSCEVYGMEDGTEILVSTLTTVIHVWSPSQTELTESHCVSYNWYGTTYTESGDYEHVVQSVHGCDSLLLLHLTIFPTETTQLNVMACEAYEWYGNTYTQTGTYQYHEQTVNGCDSLVVLHLEIGENFSSEEEASSCHSYSWRGNTYTESGTYTDVVQNAMGCDSTFVLRLTIGQDASADTVVTTCEPLFWYGDTYSESGEYTHMLSTVLGCDSLIHLHLTMGHDEVHPVETEFTCLESFFWRGHYYTHSGVYYDTVLDLVGCAEIFALDLTIEDGYNSVVSEVACDQYPWPLAPGGYLTSTGNYLYEGQTVAGCDSIVNLHLTVNHTPDLVIHGLTQVAMSTDLWPGVYNYCVADSTELGSCAVSWSCSNPGWILMPSDNPYWCKLIAKTLGTATLTAVATCDSGCDAEYTLEINASYFDVDENVAEGVSMYPNPAQTQVTVCAPQLTGVGMYDSYGQKVKNLVFDRLDVVTVEVGDLRPGVYLVEIVTTTGKTVKRLMINR